MAQVPPPSLRYTLMQCHRCSDTAVVKRGESYFCGKCALTRDWQEIIDIVQDGAVETPVAGIDDDAILEAPEPVLDPFA